MLLMHVWVLHSCYATGSFPFRYRVPFGFRVELGSGLIAMASIDVVRSLLCSMAKIKLLVVRVLLTLDLVYTTPEYICWTCSRDDVPVIYRLFGLVICYASLSMLDVQRSVLISPAFPRFGLAGSLPCELAHKG